MDLMNINGAAYMAYQYGITAMQPLDLATLSAKTGTISGGNFLEIISKNVHEISDIVQSGETDGADSTEAYMKHLKGKYGVVRIESIGKDQRSLDRAGATMGGGEVIIAPNMFEQMAENPKKAEEIEGKIDYFFNNIPKYKMEAAAMGLTFESCGCVVHEDGTVTHICGGGDTPERVAEVERIHKEEREKKAARMKESIERSKEVAERQKELMEQSWKQHMIIEKMQNNANNLSAFSGQSDRLVSISAEYGFGTFVQNRELF